MNKSKRTGSKAAVWAIAAFFFALGCSGPAALRDESLTVPNDGLNGTLWALRSAEYDAAAFTVFRSAESALAHGLADSAWSALDDQMGRAGYTKLPPAVILDADETVLDNGIYQAELVTEDRLYSSESWLAWVLEARAGAIPGALQFARRAEEMGVTVIYLTNRRSNMEAATRDNLIALGFPVDTTFDAVLTRGERPEWGTSDKTGRRRYVAENFRILALIGDDLNDFVNVEDLSGSQRDDEVVSSRSFWGERWFMLPNPQYGSWERASFDSRYDLSLSERRRLKMDRLRELLEE